MPEIFKITSQKLKNYLYHLPLAFVSALINFFPAKKLKVIGVTGTDGKTTTVTLIYEILKKAGFRVAMVSTVCAKINNEEIDTGFHVTSPDPWLLQKLLKKMVNEGIKYVVLEATSHGLDQFRFFGVNFNIGVITNVTHEHLDYHQNFQNYLKAKSKLFKNVEIAVLNKDDKSFEYLSNKLKTKKAVRIVTYGIKSNADFTLKSFPFKTLLPGEYNQYNCLAAAAATSSLGISPPVIRKAIREFKGVRGRMDCLNFGQNFTAIVDFAHTPNALEQVLKTLKSKKSPQSKIIVVFGSAGLRDKTKRPLMGEIAGKYADFSILTAEDPRTEKVIDICEQIAQGCRKVNGNYKIIEDRQKAIEYACQIARKNDIVIVCGKGHEKSMCFGTKEYPWSDYQAIEKAIKKILSKQK